MAHGLTRWKQIGRTIFSDAKPRRSTKRKGRSIERLESRTCLSSVTFVAHEIESNHGTPAAIGDLDGDDELDAIFYSHATRSLSWYKGVAGARQFVPAEDIPGEFSESPVALTSDIDGDGDGDLLIVSSHLSWSENLDGRGSFGDPKTILQNADSTSHYRFDDIDGDGDDDLVGTSSADGRVFWLENSDGLGTFDSPQTVDANAFQARSPLTGDIDRDGDIDIVLAMNSSTIVWYENIDGQGTFAEQRIITQFDAGADSLSIADADADGDLDLLAVVQRGTRIAIYENTDGLGSFSRLQFQEGRGKARFADMDQDGDVDIVTEIESIDSHPASYIWHENDGTGNFSSFHEITPVDGWELLWADESPGSATAGFVIHYVGEQPFEQFVTGDVDGDGQLDAIGLTENMQVIGFSNVGRQHSFSRPQFITASKATRHYRCGTIELADIDGDADLDLLFAWTEMWGPFSSFDQLKAEISWHENVNGRFETKHLLSTDFGSDQVKSLDIDGDGDLDLVLSSSHIYCGNDRLSWRENLDGRGSFGEPVFFEEDASHRYVVDDVDGDGDPDFVTSGRSGYENRITWHENVDGRGNFKLPQLIAPGSHSLVLADVDGDRFPDLITISRRSISIYRNANNLQRFVASEAVHVGESKLITATDFDMDGDSDLITCLPSNHEIGWRENRNGFADFAEDEPLLDMPCGWSTAHNDFDGDGDIDFILPDYESSDWTWYENRLIGDSDNNGLFDSSDLVKIFQSGKYDQNLEYATFDEGDWNGDGVFDSSDLVLAFQTGNYVHAAMPDSKLTDIRLLFDSETKERLQSLIDPNEDGQLNAQADSDELS